MRPLLLRLTVAFISLNAAAGIMALLAGATGEFGRFEGRIFATTLTISVTGFVLMPCVLAAATLRFGNLPLVPVLAGITSLAGGALFMFGLWSDTEGGVFWRSTGSVVFSGLGLAHVCRLPLLSLSRGLSRLRLAAYAFSVLLAAELAGPLTAPTGGTIR